jgi:hypothetical protein
MGETKDAYEIVVWIPEDERPVGEPRVGLDHRVTV